MYSTTCMLYVLEVGAFKVMKYEPKVGHLNTTLALGDEHLTN